jgi:phosphomannomutase
MVKNRIAKFPSSGEINFKVDNAESTLSAIEHYNWQEAFHIKRIDGIDMIFKEWRLNIRSSNTEPVIRLNIEAKENNTLLLNKLNIVKKIIHRINHPQIMT